MPTGHFPRRKYRNRPKSKSGLKGVIHVPIVGNTALRRPWKAYIRHHGQYVTIGYFATKFEAAMAYNKRALKQFGTEAYLNPLSRDMA